MRMRPLLLSSLFVLVACGRTPSATSPEIMSFKEFQTQETFDGVSTAAVVGCGDHCQMLRQEFRYIVDVGNEIYCYWDLKRVDTRRDFDALAASIELEITDATDLSAYFWTVNKWSAAFHDGHVNIMPNTDPNLPKVFTAPAPLAVIGAGTDHERVLFVDPTPDSGVLSGEELIAVNGVPVRDALDAMESGRSGSTKAMRRGRASLLLSRIGAQLGAENLTVRVADSIGTERDVNLYRQIAMAPSLPPVDTGNQDATNNVKTRILPGGVGYLRVDTFSANGLPDVIKNAMDNLSAVRGLVIDVRRNGGGDLLSGNAIMARFITETTTRYEVSENVSSFVINDRPEYYFLTRSSDANYNEWHPNVVEPVNGGDMAGMPVVILTGPRCFSACDTFTVGMKTNGLATVMGEGTGGGTGTPLGFDLPISGYAFRYSIVRGRTISGDWIEGKGTEPDVYVEPDVMTTLGKADNQIEQAYAHVLHLLEGVMPEPTPVAPGLIAAHGSVLGDAPGVSGLVADMLEIKRVQAKDERR